ncbi:nucleotidyltransferase domain-containing protein [Ammonifex thiophilus]|uniref:Uncharacterized protein n=1 Tax=Ammonifex thiophilus TaxID=444093 RepID=A0A3D8P626_9THEO|nr:nucleotidyltransferase domain-containing protein [Ammonifex thiophilus]RDV83600.1 hypothetical protein DXX99_04690 [Ammonifex thiophilus]
MPAEGFSYAALYADLSVVLKSDRLDLVALRLAPTYLQAEIIGSGRCLYASSKEEQYHFETGKRGQWRDERYRWLHALQEGRPIELRAEFVLEALAGLYKQLKGAGGFRNVLDASTLMKSPEHLTGRRRFSGLSVEK